VMRIRIASLLARNDRNKTWRGEAKTPHPKPISFTSFRMTRA
jgi:hypothetical protein